MFQPHLNFEFEPPLENETHPKGITFYLENFLKDEAREEREKRLHDYLSFLKKIFDNENNYIDHGGIAKVYSFEDRDVCVKIMKDRHLSVYKDMYDLGNRPAVEFAIMERLHGFSAGGIRSPIAEACLESGESAAIIMEKLDAVNLQHVLNGTEKMPQGFNKRDFLDSLEEYLNELHDTQGVAHMDLYARNVMIDRKTAKAYVIDFGRSELLDALPEELRKTKVKDDLEKYNIISSELDKLDLGEELRTEIIPTRNEVHQFGRATKIHYSKAMKQESHRIAETLIKDNLEIASIALGEAKESLFVTSNKNLVIGAHHFVLHGKDFYVGVKA